jgi:hypothetical protein
VEDMDGDDEDALLKLALALSLQEAAKPPEATQAEGSETAVAAGDEPASSSAAPTDEAARAVRCVRVCVTHVASQRAKGPVT